MASVAAVACDLVNFCLVHSRGLCSRGLPFFYSYVNNTSRRTDDGMDEEGTHDNNGTEDGSDG